MRLSGLGVLLGVPVLGGLFTCGRTATNVASGAAHALLPRSADTYRRLGALGQRANDCREHAQIIWFCARSAGSP